MGTLQKPSKIFYGWWIVIACFFISLYTSGVVFYGFTAIFKPIAEEFGWSYVEVSLAASIRGMEAGILAPLLGLVVDRWGARKLLVISVISTVSGLLLMSQMQSIGMFYATSFLMALGNSSAGISITSTVIGHWFRRNVGLATGIMVCGHGSAGLLVSVITKLVEIYDWRVALLILAVSMAVLIFPFALVVRNKPEPYGYLPDGDDADSFTNLGVLTTPVEKNVSAKVALKSRAFWHITLGLFPHFIAVGAVFTHVMPYLSSMGFSRSTGSMVATLIPVVSIIGRFGMGWLSDRISKRLLATCGITAMAIGLVCFEYTTPELSWLLFFFVVLFGIGYGGDLVMLGILLQEHFGKANYGTIVGITWGILYLGNMAGPPIAGWFFDTYHSYQYVWLLIGVMSVLGVFVMASTPKAKADKSKAVSAG